MTYSEQEAKKIYERQQKQKGNIDFFKNATENLEGQIFNASTKEYVREKFPNKNLGNHSNERQEQPQRIVRSSRQVSRQMRLQKEPTPIEHLVANLSNVAQFLNKQKVTIALAVAVLAGSSFAVGTVVGNTNDDIQQPAPIEQQDDVTVQEQVQPGPVEMVGDYLHYLVDSQYPLKKHYNENPDDFFVYSSHEEFNAERQQYGLFYPNVQGTEVETPDGPRYVVLKDSLNNSMQTSEMNQGHTK